MKNMVDAVRLTALGCILLAALLEVLSGISGRVPYAYAENISDTDWVSFFGSEDMQAMEFSVTMLTPFGEQHAIQKVTPKGKVTIDGKEYRESVVIHDKGFLANKVIKTHLRMSNDGLYERRSDGTEILLVPRPLEVGQKWKNGNETRHFNGIEDFETFKQTVPACARITVTTEELDLDGKTKVTKIIQYYERGKGLIYKGTDDGPLGVTKILNKYDSQTGSR